MKAAKYILYILVMSGMRKRKRRLKKYKVEIWLGIILVVSFTMLIVNIISKAAGNSPDKQNAEEQYTLPTAYDSDDTSDLYTNIKDVSEEVFRKYFIKNIGEKVSYVSYVEMPGVNAISNDSAINVVEEMQVNSVTYQNEYNGEGSAKGCEYVIVNITAYNNCDYGRIVYLTGFSLGYKPDLDKLSYTSKKLYEKSQYRDYDSEMMFYTSKIINSEGKKIEYTITGEDTGDVYMDANTSVTYNIVWQIEEQHKDNLALIRRLNKKKLSNTDFIILLK